MTGKIDISPEQLAIVQGVLKDHLLKGTLTWAFGSRVTWTAKPFSDLDIALEGAAPLAPDVLIDLEEAFDASDLPWKVDLIDLNAVSPEFRAIVERQRVPVDWATRKIGDITLSLNAKRVPVSSLERSKRKGEYPYYGASGVVDYIDGYLFDGTYLLISEDGENLRTRKTPIAFKATGQFWVNNHAHILDEIEPGILDFLERGFRGLDISAFITGAVQPKLNKRSLEQIELQVPPVDERLRINSMLGALDDKIALNGRMNETLEALARAVFRDWFVDFGPTRRKAAGATNPVAILGGLLPDPAKAAELAALFPGSFGANSLPEGWEWSSVGAELQTFLGGTPSRSRKDFWEGDIPWINSGKANEFRVLEPSEYISQLGFEKSATKLLPKRTTLIAITGATLGQVSLNEIEVCANQSIVGVVGNRRFPSEFVYCWIQENTTTLIASQTGGAQQHINKNNVNALSIIKPSKESIEAWSEVAVPLFNLVASNCFENQTLAATRDLLLPKLMSGELRLTGAEGDA